MLNNKKVIRDLDLIFERDWVSNYTIKLNKTKDFNDLIPYQNHRKQYFQFFFYLIDRFFF